VNTETVNRTAVNRTAVNRTAIVAAAAKRWQHALVDDSGRNQLAYYRDLKVGTLNLDGARLPQLMQLLAGRPVALRHLFPEPEAHADAMKRMRAVRKHMRMWQEERGVEVGYLVTGLATWSEPGRTPRAPVLLQSLTVKPSSALQTDFILDTDTEPSLNPVLLHKLHKDYGLAIASEELEDLKPEDLFAHLVKLADDVPDFRIQKTSLVGTFTYAKLPMVDDIGDAIDVLCEHDVIAALAGDTDALTKLNTRTGVNIDAPDAVPPADEFVVLDADSSQSYVINSVIADQHLVIKGPPGTGKSQTIANLIAALAAHGRTALFVAEKRAAIDAVLDRLHHVGLDDLVHNLHGEQQSRRELARSLEARLQRARTEAEPEAAEVHQRLTAARDSMARHHRAMHEPRQPWGFSVFNMQAGLVGLPPTPHRWSGERLLELHGATADRRRAAVAELAKLNHSMAASPWTPTAITDRGQAQDAFALAGAAATQWPRAQRASAALTAELGFAPAENLDAMRQAVQLAADVRHTLQCFRPEIYDADLSAWDGFFRRRRTVKLMRSLWIGQSTGHGRAKAAELRTAATAIADQKTRWQRVALNSRALNSRALDGGALNGGALNGGALNGGALNGGALNGARPRIAASLDEAQSSVTAASDTLQRLYAYLPVDDLLSRLDALATDQRGLLDAVRRNELLAELRPWGAERLDGADMFDYAWLHSILDAVRFTDDHLGRFRGALQHEAASSYRTVDTAHISIAASRVRYHSAKHLINVLDEFPEQQRLVRNEAAKKTRHLTVRRLFEQAPQALVALKPCWAMSPLLASQVLPARTLFDVVIFDEASQVEPVDAITAIMRGRQVVVAGDEHQLPPTAFFNRAEPDEEDALDFDGDINGREADLPTDNIESLLQSFANTLPLDQVKYLSWHYRSRDERLIAFSNKHIYAPSGNELVTFPGADTVECLNHVLVTGDGTTGAGITGAGITGAETTEVGEVVRLMLEHAEQRPNESLGVITMGIKHADLIDMALHKALAKRPDLAAFFTESGLEPYFVKNIERVQGDERDAIILSVGYPKGPDGRMRYLFGPLNQKGGERRLNVAVTRAKHRLTLVSSFGFLDMDPNKLRAQGARLLRSYLEYVQLGGITDPKSDAGLVNSFEADVRDSLAAAGIPVIPKYGVSGFRVDFAAHHASDPRRMVLAIETDGNTYRAGPTVRDRDRLRQEHLERLGWHFHRIWSPDWFLDREREIGRVVQAYRAALVEPVPVVEEPAPVSAPATIKQRGARPQLPEYDSISDLPDHLLAELVKWVESDGLNRTEEEVVTETIAELGFTRRGSRIVEAVKRARQMSR